MVRPICLYCGEAEMQNEFGMCYSCAKVIIKFLKKKRYIITKKVEYDHYSERGLRYTKKLQLELIDTDFIELVEKINEGIERER